jgi:hypothetical protein
MEDITYWAAFVLRMLATVIGITGLVIGTLFLIRWGYTEWWISTHCTTDLGTRVCPLR